MQNVPPDIQPDDDNTGLITSLITEFTVSYRFFRSYPDGHPVVTASLHKMISRFDRVLGGNGEIIIAVAKDALIVENNFLNRSNPIFRNFAAILFERGIGALLLRQALTIKELKAFYTILALKREEIAAQGGIETVWNKAHLSALGIHAIRYDLFSATECDILNDSSAVKGLWERFARGLINGTLGHRLFGDGGYDPEQLAQMLNKRYREEGADFAADLVDLLKPEYSEEPHGSRWSKVPYEQIAIFAAHLNPDLRRHFISASFDIRTIEGNPVVENIIGCMSPGKALETLEEFERSKADVPEAIVRLLERLAGRPDTSRRPETVLLPQEDPLEIKMRLILSEHGIVEQLSPDGQHTPPQAPVLPEAPPGTALNEQKMLLNTLEPMMVENRIGEIILCLAASGNDLQTTENLAQNLAEMCRFLLQTGDYHQLHRIIGQTSDPALPVTFRSLLAESFSQQDFLDEIMDGLTIWGKSRFQDIRLLIGEIGAPFIEPLLNKLASEENMSLRRFIMDRLLEFGPAAKNSILARINDGPWYYQRNLLMMLGTYADPGLASHIRPLLKHENSKVRQDALHCLLQYQDPAAERQLANDLENNNKAVKLAAITAAKKSRSTDVFNRLLAIIAKSGLSNADVEFKSATINSLKEMGRIEALPVLTGLLDSSNLLRANALAKLKLEAIRSLESYPSREVTPILMKLAAGHTDQARQAAASLHVVRTKK